MFAAKTPNHYTAFTQALQAAEAAGGDEAAAKPAVLAAAAHLAMATARVIVGQAEARTDLPARWELWLDSKKKIAKYRVGSADDPINAAVEFTRIARRDRKHYHPALLIGGGWALSHLQFEHQPKLEEGSGATGMDIRFEGIYVYSSPPENGGGLAIKAERILSLEDMQAMREPGGPRPNSRAEYTFDSTRGVGAEQNIIALRGIGDTVVRALNSGLDRGDFYHPDVAQDARDQLQPSGAPH